MKKHRESVSQVWFFKISSRANMPSPVCRCWTQTVIISFSLVVFPLTLKMAPIADRNSAKVGKKNLPCLTKMDFGSCRGFLGKVAGVSGW